SGMNKWRAGCVETCTSGSEGGPQKPTASKDRQGAAVRPLHHRRLYKYCGDIPPVDLEAAYYAQHRRPAAG
ncbi:hypothetical protein, partial [Mycobacterium heckeshornense]|uniref:hypothetical protein n=1 Tax=Mycobacterium heckeshornense TaxID=110505 RepID=UPI0021F3929A